jgi:hypothetical protein
MDEEYFGGDKSGVFSLVSNTIVKSEPCEGMTWLQVTEIKVEEPPQKAEPPKQEAKQDIQPPKVLSKQPERTLT